MDNATKCKCGAPSVTRACLALMLADLSEDLSGPGAALLVDSHARAALRMARYAAGACIDCVHGTRREVA